MNATTSDDVRNVIIIPCRMDGRRLPGKPMMTAAGRPLVRWVYDLARRVGNAQRVIVATADDEIIKYCSDNGMLWQHTRADHPTGTHRCAEVLKQFDDVYLFDPKVVVNWQVDEVCVNPKDVARLIDYMKWEHDVATLVTPDLAGMEDDRDVVKVATSEDGRCRWFSRSALAGAGGHCGIYAFQPHVLRRLGKQRTTPLSRAESLEQLAWLESAHTIQAIEIDKLPLAINTRQNLDQFREYAERM